MLDEIIIPYSRNKRRRLNVDISHPGLSIMDVFKGQATQLLLELLKENNIFLTKVPPNITNLYQTLYFTVNGFSNAFMKEMFTEWNASKI